MITVRDYIIKHTSTRYGNINELYFDKDLNGADIFEEEQPFYFTKEIVNSVNERELVREMVIGIYKDYDWYVKE
jgi:hypothetical protein